MVGALAQLPRSARGKTKSNTIITFQFTPTYFLFVFQTDVDITIKLFQEVEREHQLLKEWVKTRKARNESLRKRQEELLREGDTQSSSDGSSATDTTKN